MQIIALMDKLYTFLLFLCLLNGYAISFAQDEHHAFLEIGGPGGYGSLNYEHQWGISSLTSIVSRVGLSTYSLSDYTTRFNPDLIVPITGALVYGDNHMLEVGTGVSIASIVTAGSDFTLQRDYRYYGNVLLGYRYQKSESKVVYRAGYSPLYSFQNFFHWAFMSIGYAF